MTSAKTELSTVTTSRLRIPKRNLLTSLTTKSSVVKKLAWLARKAGTACTSRNTAISTIATMMEMPEAVVRLRKTMSPRRPVDLDCTLPLAAASGMSLILPGPGAPGTSGARSTLRATSGLNFI